MKEKKREWLRRLPPAFVALICIASVLLIREIFWLRETETLGEAKVFERYIRRRDGITSYIGRDTFGTLPEDCFSEYISDDGLMRITLSNTACGTPPGNSDGRSALGWYFVEGWFDWLEIPAIRGKDEVWLTMRNAVYAGHGHSMVIRYTLEGDSTEYTAIYDGNLYGQEISLPKGRLTGLQIYLGIYMHVQMSDVEAYHSVIAEYKHYDDASLRDTAQTTRYYHFYNTHYVPREDE